MSSFFELENSFFAFDHFRFDERHWGGDGRDGKPDEDVEHGAEGAELSDERNVAVAEKKPLGYKRVESPHCEQSNYTFKSQF